MAGGHKCEYVRVMQIDISTEAAATTTFIEIAPQVCRRVGALATYLFPFGGFPHFLFCAPHPLRSAPATRKTKTSPFVFHNFYTIT